MRKLGISRRNLGESPNLNYGSASTPIDLTLRSQIVAPPVDRDKLLLGIARDTHILSSLQTLDPGLITYSFTVNTTATLIIPASKNVRGYWLINPSFVVGATATGTITNQVSQTANGNTQASALGVANYRDMHLYLNVTAGGGGANTLSIIAQSQDPATNNWADSQTIFNAINANGTYYANPGSLGLGVNYAIRWVISAGTWSFTVGYALKDGLPGSPAGTGKAIYLGTNSGISVGGGFPLMEAQKEKIYLSPDTELWGIANIASTLNVIELSRITPNEAIA